MGPEEHGAARESSAVDRDQVSPGVGSGLRVGVLGPVMVVRDGVELPVLPGGQRAVLGLLALAHGSPVRLGLITDALWGEQPPVTAVGIVHTYVSRLRSVLDRVGAGREHLPAADGAGYRLQVAEDELDLLGFRRLIEDARRARVAGAVGEALGGYERGLALWRDEPLADVEVLHGHPALTALAAEHAAVVLEFADLASGTGGGWHDRVLPYVRALTVRDRLDEALHARLMIALAGTGRQAEALGVYEGLRLRLDEQLGVLPGPALRAAHAQVLRQEIPTPGPALAQAPVLARVPAVAEGGGWRPVCQLPAAPADFTGRGAEREDLVSVLCPGEDHPGVPVAVVSGAPGVGKTSLVLYTAHKVRARFPDGQLWVHLAGASTRPRDSGDVLGELLRALGVPGSAIPDACSERAACYRSRLAGRRVLVVADDAATAAQIRPLVPGTPGCALVATSRTRLEDLDGAHLVPLEVMAADDAVGLLARLVGADRVAAELDAASSLVETCGALPLALRITGAKLAARPSWPLSTMLRRITSNQDRLRELETGDLSVRASIASSYESLPERLQRAFRLIALLGPGDFAEWVIGALLGEPDAADVAGELSSRSLLTTIGADATGEPRYRLHDLLRDYAAEHLDKEPAADKDAALGRLLNGWVQLAQLADSQLPPEPYFPPRARMVAPDILHEKEAGRLAADPVAWFTTERVNLLIAVEQACRTGRLGVARQLASHQCAYQHLQDRHDDSELMWRTIADYAEKSGNSDLRNDAMLRIGASMVERGHVTDAFPLFDRSVMASVAIADHEAVAFALYWRGACASYVHDFEQARRDAEEGVRAARRAGSRLAELMNLRALMEPLAQTGNSQRAVEVSEQAVAIASDLGVASYELAALHNLAYASLLSGNHHRAKEMLLRRLEFSRKLGDIRAEALSLALLGDVYQALGQYKTAAHCLHRALPLFRAHHADLHHATCLLKLGYAYEAMACHREALDYLEESVLRYQQLRVPNRAELAQRALDRCRAAIADTTASSPE